MADEEDTVEMARDVPALEIIGSALNQRTGQITLFLVSTAKRTELEAAGLLSDTDSVMANTEHVVELCEHLAPWCVQQLAQLCIEQAEWRRAQAWKARQN